tara:strand:+ start:187 stop:462 length:276 start_codon:yes stop_codon:yes gene_type:complete
MKISKKQLRQIIREERARLSEQGYNMARAPGGNKMIDHTIFKASAIYDLIEKEIDDYLVVSDADGLAQDEADRMELALNDAIKALISDYVL